MPTTWTLHICSCMDCQEMGWTFVNLQKSPFTKWQYKKKMSKWHYAPVGELFLKCFNSGYLCTFSHATLQCNILPNLAMLLYIIFEDMTWMNQLKETEFLTKDKTPEFFHHKTYFLKLWCRSFRILYSYTLTPYPTCPKIWTTSFNYPPINVS